MAGRFQTALGITQKMYAGVNTDAPKARFGGQPFSSGIHQLVVR
jgi:hypothetical protein